MFAVIMGETSETVFSASLQKMKHVKSDEGDMLTKPFLDVCKLVLPIIGMFFLLIYYFIDNALPLVRYPIIQKLDFDGLFSSFLQIILPPERWYHVITQIYM